MGGAIMDRSGEAHGAARTWRPRSLPQERASGRQEAVRSGLPRLARGPSAAGADFHPTRVVISNACQPVHPRLDARNTKTFRVVGDLKNAQLAEIQKLSGTAPVREF